MDFHRILVELRAEQQRIAEAISVVERIASGQPGRRRGRPPKFLSNLEDLRGLAGAPRKRRKFSAATRKRMAESQRKRWAARKAGPQAA